MRACHDTASLIASALAPEWDNNWSGISIISDHFACENNV